jgi:hypothetical protein
MLTIQGGITRAEGKRFRKGLLRDLAAGDRKRQSVTLSKLMRERAAKKKERREKLKKAKTRCCATVRSARARAAETYALDRTHDHEAVKAAARSATTARVAKRSATVRTAFNTCAADRSAVEATAAKAVGEVQKQITEEKDFRHDMRTIKRTNDARDKDRRRASSAERRSESDGAVVANIPEELIPLWNRVKQKIKGSDRRSRTEEFLQYVEENPDEVIDARQAYADRELDRELRQQQREHKHQAPSVRKATPRRAKRAAVPF